MHARLRFEKAFDLCGRTKDNLIVWGISKEKRGGWRVVMKERQASLFLQHFELNTFFEDIPNLGYGACNSSPLTVSACSGWRPSFWCRGLGIRPDL
jgi:hypothetical protein